MTHRVSVISFRSAMMGGGEGVRRDRAKGAYGYAGNPRNCRQSRGCYGVG